MRPLLVLLLVIAAIGAFFLAMNAGEGDGGTSGLPGPDVGAPATEDVGDGTPADLDDPDRTAIVGNPTPPLAAPERVEAIDPNAKLGNSLSGIVRTDDGAPVQSAEVTLTRYGQFSMLFGDPSQEERSADRTVKTNKAGEFVFTDVETFTEYSLIANHPEFGRKEEGNIQIAEGEAKTGILITLSGGVKIHGIITDTSGSPVSGATMYLGMSALGAFADQEGPSTTKLATDGSGAYAFRNVANGNYSLSVYKEGYGRVTIPQVNITGNDDIEKDIVLEVAHMIAGSVVSTNGGAVPEAIIQAFSMTNRQESTRSQVTSDETGEFILDDVRSGTYTLLVKAEGFKAERMQRIDTGDMSVRVELIPLPVVKGRVTDSLGQPVRNFTVLLRQPIQNAETTMPLSDTRKKFSKVEGGEFTLACPNHGEYLVEAQANGYAPCFSERFSIVFGQELTGVVVQMTQGGSIRGRIVDDNGDPVANARIKTHDTEYVDDPFWRSIGEFPSQATVMEVRSGETGDFELSGLSPASYQIDVRHAEFSHTVQRKISVQEAQITDVGDVRVSSGATVSGTVVGPAGKGLPGAMVQLQREANSTTDYGASYSTRTDVNGNYSFPHVPGGTYEVHAQRQSGGGSPFQGSLDVKKTKRKIVVRDGTSYTEDFNIPN